MQPHDRNELRIETLKQLENLTTSIDEEKEQKPTFYEKEKVETTILMSGTTKLTEEFIETVKTHYVFKGNDRFCKAKIFGTVIIYYPDEIFKYDCHRFQIDKKTVGDQEYYAIWFVRSESEIVTTLLSDVVKAWCKFRHINIDCEVTQEILKKCV